MSRQRVDDDDQAAAIDALGDDLLVCILDKVDCLRTIARCEAVSRRWRHVCSLVGTVHVETRRYKRATLVEAVWRMLAFRSFRIRRLEFTPEGVPSDIPCLGSWIRLISPTLEVLKISVFNQRSLPLECSFPKLTHLELIFGERCYTGEGTWPLKWTTLSLVVLKVAFPANLSWVQELVNRSQMLEELEVMFGSIKEEESSSFRIKAPKLTSLAVTTSYWIRDCAATLHVDAPALKTLYMDCHKKLMVKFNLTSLPGGQLDELVVRSPGQGLRGVKKLKTLVFEEERRWTAVSIATALESFHGIEINKIKLNFSLVTSCNSDYGFDSDDTKVQCVRLHVNPSFDGDSPASLLTTFDVLDDFALRTKCGPPVDFVKRVAIIVDVPNKESLQAILHLRRYYNSVHHSMECMYVFSDGEFTADFIDLQRKKLLKFRCVQGVSAAIVRRTLRAESLPTTIKHDRGYQRRRKAAALAAARPAAT